VKLIFFDESKNDPEYPHYHIGAVCIDEEHLSKVEQQVSAIAEKAFETTELSRATELHAADIYHRKSNFKDWPNFGDRLELLSDFAEILSRQEVQLIDVQINCALLQGAQSAEEIAFMYLCERADDLVQATNSLGMLIGDRESDHEADRFSRTLSGYRARGTDFAFGRKIHNLVDSVHFTHSHLSRFLQLADVYAWLLQFFKRNHNSGNERHRAVFELLKREGINLFPAKYKEWPK
jgi:hypothetical protein